LAAFALVVAVGTDGGPVASRPRAATGALADREPGAISSPRAEPVWTSAGCAGAPIRVGATLPTDPSEPLQTVTDIYSVWGGPEGAVEIAWFYFADDGKTIFLQYNYASIATYGARALGIRLDSVATPGGFGSVVRWNHQPVARRYRVMKCTSHGGSS
jgi:hypothetical protein